MSTPVASRWKVVCAYDGTGFAGWQSQPGGGAIQDVIEARLAEMLGGLVRIHGSGRTDAGVHARGQVFHFDAAWRHGPERLRAALRVGLPATIQLRRVTPAPEGFHARFSATGKRYHYRLIEGEADPFTRPFVWCLERPRRLDEMAMRAAAEHLQGRHDFAGFAARRGGEEEDTVRDLRRVDLVRRGRRWRMGFEADGFLYKMVRSLVGALVAVGEGKLTPDEVRAILEQPRRTAAVETCPPQGLFLEKVFYGRDGSA
jgi:tRNA pseudouridine38-40 synthase